MGEKRLSIIIPFFNVENYISECLDSVFDQDVPFEDYEVICVNDGSPDRSREIVVDYMKRFNNLTLVEHDRNRKLGTARNTGREKATGKYIWNVDSDDKIVPNCIGYLLKICEENDLDVLEFGSIRFSGEKREEMRNVKSTEEVVSGLDYLQSLSALELSTMCPVWRRLVRRGLLDDNRIYSPEINMGEDVPFSFRVLVEANRMMVLPDCCYYYRANPDSLTGINWMPMPFTLYEKCFVGARLISDVAAYVPICYNNVRKSFKETARYTLNLYTVFLPKMSIDNQKQFKALCKKGFRDNSFVKKLLSKKKYVNYLLWLVGVKSLPL